MVVSPPLILREIVSRRPEALMMQEPDLGGDGSFPSAYLLDHGGVLLVSALARQGPWVPAAEAQHSVAQGSVLPWDPLALVIVHVPTGMLIFEQVMYRAANACGLADMIEIARHFRDEAAQLLDARIDEALAQAFTPSFQDRLAAISISAAPAGTCCTPTPSGQACC
jgi:hypothetical protein